MADNDTKESKELLEEIETLNKAFRTQGIEFRGLISTFISDLAYQKDTEMRFLGVRINFNETYPLKPRRIIAGKKG